MTDRNKIILLLALVVVLVGINLVPRPSQESAPSAASKPAVTRAAAQPALPAIPDASLDVARLQFTPRERAAAVRRNIFEYGVQTPPPAQPSAALASPPPAPPPPPAPVRFFGFAENPRGGKRQVFLTDGEEIFVAAEGDIISQRYRLLRVASESVEVEELQGKRRWIVPLEQR